MARSSSEAEWLRTRKEWLEENPPNHQGYYTCYICHKWIPANEITLDHVIPRSRAPHLKYQKSNLAPACGLCNYLKGSRVYEQVPQPKVELEDVW